MVLLSGVFRETPINRQEINQNILDIEDKTRTNPLPWKGQFSPQFIEALLDKYADKNSVVFDPFLGSGTVLYEAGRCGIEAYGTDINPAAFTLASIYRFINLFQKERERYTKSFLNRLKIEMYDTMPLFQKIPKAITPNDLIDKVIALALNVNDEDIFINILNQALVIMLDLSNKEVTHRRIFHIAELITDFVQKLPYSEKPINVYNVDARNVPLQNYSVNLVITSPPYINVFNYHQQYRTSTEALNWNLLEVAKSEFGSNRKHRSNRFITVIQYCLDIASTLQELLRICKAESRMIFVVGRESNIRDTPFFNGELVAEVAHRVLGINLDMRQERSFLNRYGKIIKEDILHFVSIDKMDNYFDLDRAKTVAIEALETAYLLAEDKVKDEIQDAIEKAGNVKPSPYYNRDESRNQVDKLKSHHNIFSLNGSDEKDVLSRGYF
ncbi:MAG TPA: hypothetical protein DEG17_19325 [Cyanobacteria bacterium UBA11149]|nr:hypothetical protein [Cyanobacteria bacterium UBA11367]HBE57897.1 hypothetical protein [Cyanobacteria bacterium UBA11366]HBK65648.1 hypothetical protein [Cyanobacteria bacterium UBA11166]HBR74848.1 hypothetical protein [Cyanobacteria bacterium UBA11159]HBS69069.1 hypothetical protein [Cyanobacteria bacterium UBA11153]HBW90956.1 hypothetical protein [Cyanobacteria bacterium UBA11149]HCA95050.1 hypothetical protein [Cyanobacteria bacterium UBA9226]